VLGACVLVSPTVHVSKTALVRGCGLKVSAGEWYDPDRPQEVHAALTFIELR